MTEVVFVIITLIAAVLLFYSVVAVFHDVREGWFSDVGRGKFPSAHSVKAEQDRQQILRETPVEKWHRADRRKYHNECRIQIDRIHSYIKYRVESKNDTTSVTYEPTWDLDPIKLKYLTSYLTKRGFQVDVEIVGRHVPRYVITISWGAEE